MPKIIFTQEFDAVEEQSEFLIASQALEMACAIDDILQMLRRYDKYGHTFNSIEEAIEKIREEACDIVSSHNVVLE